MFQRVMVAVVCIPLLLVILFLLPPIAIPIFIALLSVVGVYEALWSTGCVQNKRLCGYSVILAGCIPFWVYFGQGDLYALIGLFAYLLLVFVEAITSNYTLRMDQMGAAFFFTILVPFMLSSFVRFDLMEGGKYFLLLPLAAAFLSDAFALFAGMLFGKHKLAPTLSPKKTVEGSIGGFFGAVLGMMIYGLVLQLAFSLSVNYLFLAVYGILGSAVSQLGDLSFSYVKRQFELKDFGKLFPGHGGVLDRFDSVILCAPLFEILLRVLPAIQL